MPTKIKDESPLELTDKQFAKGSAALGGAAKGAIMGAKIGSLIPIPGVGTGLGLIAGGLIGGIGGLVKADKQIKQEEEIARETGEMQSRQEAAQQYMQNLSFLNQPNQDLVSPYPMMKPKELTPYEYSYDNMKKSSQQKKQEDKMKAISMNIPPVGEVSALPFNAKLEKAAMDGSLDDNPNFKAAVMGAKNT